MRESSKVVYGFSVYPNPTYGKLSIVGEDGDELSIIDVHGKVRMWGLADANQKVDLLAVEGGLNFFCLEMRLWREW